MDGVRTVRMRKDGTDAARSRFKFHRHRTRFPVIDHMSACADRLVESVAWKAGNTKGDRFALTLAIPRDCGLRGNADH